MSLPPRLSKCSPWVSGKSCAKQVRSSNESNIDQRFWKNFSILDSIYDIEVNLVVIFITHLFLPHVFIEHRLWGYKDEPAGDVPSGCLFLTDAVTGTWKAVIQATSSWGKYRQHAIIIRVQRRDTILAVAWGEHRKKVRYQIQKRLCRSRSFLSELWWAGGFSHFETEQKSLSTVKASQKETSLHRSELEYMLPEKEDVQQSSSCPYYKLNCVP